MRKKVKFALAVILPDTNIEVTPRSPSSGADVDLSRRRWDSPLNLSFPFITMVCSHLFNCFFTFTKLILFGGGKLRRVIQRRWTRRCLEPTLSVALSLWFIISPTTRPKAPSFALCSTGLSTPALDLYSTPPETTSAATVYSLEPFGKVLCSGSYRVALTHPLQETLPAAKLVVRASSGIDEIYSSSDILDSSPTCFIGLSDFSDEFRVSPPPSRVVLFSAVDSYSDEIGIRDTPLTPPLYTFTLPDCRHSETHSGKCCHQRVGTPSPSPAVHCCFINVTKQTLICYSENITQAWAYVSRMGRGLNHNVLCEVGLGLCFFSISAKAVPSTTLCVVLLRQPLCTSLQHQEIHPVPETGFNYSQNPSIGFFKVDYDVCAFFRTRALGLQVKLLFGSLLSLATSIFCFGLVIFVYQFTIKLCFRCNRLCLSDL